MSYMACPVLKSIRAIDIPSSPAVPQVTGSASSGARRDIATTQATTITIRCFPRLRTRTEAGYATRTGIVNQLPDKVR
jgi:hypothetical protein